MNYLEITLLYILLIPLKICGLRISSWSMQYVNIIIFSLLAKPRKIIKNNLALCFPNYSQKQLRDLYFLVLKNLGSLLGEMPFLQKMITNPHKYITISGKENLTKLLNLKTGAIIISGHISNWELFNVFLQKIFGKKYAFTYRSLNNPYTDKVLKKIRVYSDEITLLPRGISGTGAFIKCLKKGKLVGMMADQHIREGKDCKFMNIVARTTTSPAKIAIKYNVPICIVTGHKIKMLKYQLNFSDFIIPSSNGSQENIAQITKQINNHYTDIISKHPEQWFWPHRRFR